MHNINKQFTDACHKNDLNLAKQLLSEYPDLKPFGDDRNLYPLSPRSNLVFVVCEFKYFEFAEWLLLLNPKKEICETAFVNLCYYCKLDSAKWLLSKVPNIDVTTKNNYAFIWACEYAKYVWSYEQLEMAKWLQSLKPYHYILELDKFGSFVSYTVRESKEIKWLERRIPLLAYHTNTDNDFKKLNFDIIREICLFI